MNTVDRLRWHQEQGHRIVIVSASLDRYVLPVGAHLGVEDVIATSLEINPEGRLTGRLLGPNVRTHEKARRLRALLGEQPVAFGYGDSEGDREMLAMADKACWVTQRPVDASTLNGSASAMHLTVYLTDGSKPAVIHRHQTSRRTRESPGRWHETALIDTASIWPFHGS